MKIIYTEKKRVGFPVWIVLTIMLSFTSCEDFINVTPLDRVDATTFFADADQVVIGTNGVYASLRSIYGGGSPFQIVETRTDNAAMIPTEQAERIEHDTFQESPGNLNVLNTWTPWYNTINLANSIIVKGPQATAGDAALIERSVGEAKFIRALAYYNLVTLFGGVPLRLTPTTDFGNTVVPRSDVPTVYAQIRQDINDAIAVLPETYTGTKNNEKGRATKNAAIALLGKVELQAGNKPAAAAAFRQLLGKYTLLENYADIWKAGNKNTAESIFEVNFLPDNQTGFGLPGQFIPASEAARLGIVAGGSTRLTMFPTHTIINAFEPGDERKPASVAFSVANGEAYISKFIDLKAASNGHNINFVVIRYADVLLGLAEAIGESPEAYGYINQVRNRSSLGNISAATPGTFMQKLMHERQVEFAFEMQRLFDLLRLPPQEAINILEADLLTERGVNYDLTVNNLLYPIPITEIEVSKGVVTQNPGH